MFDKSARGDLGFVGGNGGGQDRRRRSPSSAIVPGLPVTTPEAGGIAQTGQSSDGASDVPERAGTGRERQETCFWVLESRRRSMKPIASLALSLALALAPSLARGQEAWPIRSVTFIIPYAAGGDTDLVVPLSAHYVRRAPRQTPIFDNRARAGGLAAPQSLPAS